MKGFGTYNKLERLRILTGEIDHGKHADLIMMVAKLGNRPTSFSSMTTEDIEFWIRFLNNLKDKDNGAKSKRRADHKSV